MSGFRNAMTIFTDPKFAAECRLVRELLIDILNADGQVRFVTLASFEQHICGRFGFTYQKEKLFGGRPILFYVNGNLCLRVKPEGTNYRPPHITISPATSFEFADELGKFNRQGELIPKRGGVQIMNEWGNWRGLSRVAGSTAEISAVDDRWADSCHFNFVPNFLTGSRATS